MFSRDYFCARAGKLCSIRLHRAVKIGIHHLTETADGATLSWLNVILCIRLVVVREHWGWHRLGCRLLPASEE